MAYSLRQFLLGLVLLLPALLSADEGNLALARELFQEDEWQRCRIEALRTLQADPQSGEARVLAASARLRESGGDGTDIDVLAQIAADEDRPPRLRALAAYEAGRAQWRRGELEQAYESMARAYLKSSSEEIFLRAGCSLFLLMDADQGLRSRSESLYSQIRSNRELYDWNLQKQCLPPESSGSGIFAKPGEWIVGIYRGQVGPAIGMRCSCVPSCSEYFRQACRKHGLLGFPLQADRFFREPSIVQQQINPIIVGDQIKYSDPVRDHDFWLE